MRKNSLSILTLMLFATVALLMISCNKKTLHSTTETASQTETAAASVIPETEPQEDDDVVLSEDPDDIEYRFFSEAIYFEYDSSDLSKRAPLMLTKMAGYIRSKPGMELTVEGHCDERGTDTYNLALGKRRAESVKTFLVSQGVPANRLDTISYGESQPATEGNNELAWANNRRVEFVVHRLLVK